MSNAAQQGGDSKLKRAFEGTRIVCPPRGDCLFGAKGAVFIVSPAMDGFAVANLRQGPRYSDQKKLPALKARFSRTLGGGLIRAFSAILK